MAVAASTSALPGALSANPAATRSHPRAPAVRGHRARTPRPGTVATSWRRFRAEATKAQREKERTEVVAVEESFPVRETAPPDGADDQMVPATDESWVVKLEQSVNIFLTESVVMILDSFYRDRNYARFFVLETIARVPYFGEGSVFYAHSSLKKHLYRCFTCTRHLAGGEELII